MAFGDSSPNGLKQISYIHTVSGHIVGSYMLNFRIIDSLKHSSSVPPMVEGARGLSGVPFRRVLI